jgi:hypothetical protein
LALAACSSLTTEAKSPPAATAAGTARVYFALNQGYPPGAGYIVEDTKLLGYLENGEHFVVDVPAGEHTFMLISEQDEAIKGTFEAGKTYHIRLFITPGVLSTRVYWVPLKNTGEDLEARKVDIGETTRMELVPAKAAEWEVEERDDMKERSDSFRTGKDEIGHTVGAEHAL